MKSDSKKRENSVWSCSCLTLTLTQRRTLAGKFCMDLATLLDLLEKKNLHLDLDTEASPEMTFCSHSTWKCESSWLMHDHLCEILTCGLMASCRSVRRSVNVEGAGEVCVRKISGIFFGTHTTKIIKVWRMKLACTWTSREILPWHGNSDGTGEEALSELEFLNF